MEQDKPMDRVVVTMWWNGLCHMQVCAVKDVTDEEILQVCNRENPSGTRNGWTCVCHEGHLYLGKDLSPVPCADHDGRIHYVVAC